MTKAEAIIKLDECIEDGDWEVAHSNADEVLCVLLEQLGYEDVVAKWRQVGKWYA